MLLIGSGLALLSFFCNLSLWISEGNLQRFITLLKRAIRILITYRLETQASCLKV